MRRWVGVLLALGVVSGCGGDSGGQVISTESVADATRSAESARLQFELSYSGLDPLASVGVIDFRTEAQEARVTTVDGGSAVMRVVGGETFIGLDEPSRSGPSWVRLPPLETNGEAAGPDDGMWLDPRAIVDGLNRAATDVRKTGSDDIHGNRTTTYRLDLRQGSDLLPGMMIPSDVSATATMNVDDHGRLSRLTVEPDEPSSPTTGTPDEFTVPVPRSSTLELWDFGVAVDVQAPADSDVVDFHDPEGAELLSLILN